MLAQATGFALLAAVSPTALLVMAVFLSSANPRRTAFMYAAGAVLMTIAMAVAVLFIIRAAHLNDGRHHDPRFGLRFALGVLSLLICAVLVLRPKRTESSDGQPKKPGFIARMTASPHPRTAFIVGVIIFAPSATFIAAVQAVATADATVPLTVAALVIVILLSVLAVWLPLLAYLFAPDATTRSLRQASGWLGAHSRTLVTAALGVAGLALVVNGSVGLWG